MKMKYVTCLLIAVAVVSQAAATPIEWSSVEGGNGHYYEVVAVSEAINWSGAKDEAKRKTHDGLVGHLVTLTSQEENTFVTELMAGNEDTGWAGGFQLPNSEEPDEGWTWITGETWDYTAWRSPYEPNNNGDENAIELFASDHTMGPSAWNDLSKNNSLTSYIVEYEVPEPATLSLLAIGGLTLIRRRK